jgi:uncharacterized protein YegL
MKVFQNILDRMLTAPGEAPGQVLAVRTNSAKTVQPTSDSAVKPMAAARKTKSRARAESTDIPPTVYLLLDVSASMDKDKLRQARDGGTSFAKDAVFKGYLVGVIQFTSWAWLRVAPTMNLTVIREGLVKTGLQLSTNMAAAIERATTEFGKSQGLRAMVLVTDGYPDNAEAALAAATKAKRRDITIIAIGTDDADRNFLKKLASASHLTTVPDEELETAIVDAARLLPAKRS